MKTLLLAAIAGVFLFSGSAAVSWYLMNQQQMANPETEQEQVDAESADGQETPPTKNVEKSEEMPVGLRPETPISLDAVMQLSRSVRLKEQQLKAEEERLKKEEEGLKMMFTDLKLEREQIVGFAEQIDSKLRKLRELVEQVKVENEKLEAKKKEISAATGQPAGASQAVAPDLMKEVALAQKVMAKMEAQNAAVLLKNYVNRGELKLAGLVIKAFDERQASKVLTELSATDPELATQLIRAATENQ